MEEPGSPGWGEIEAYPSSQTAKYCRKSHGTWNQESLWWRGPAAIISQLGTELPMVQQM
jgi:hypothetical protein